VIIPRIAVVGSINLDTNIRLAELPRRGETIAATGLDRSPGGKGANVAAAAAQLGADVHMIGCVGSDDGEQLIQDLHNRGVRTQAIVIADGPSGSAIAMRDVDGENAIVVHSGANGQLQPEAVTKSLVSLSPAMVIANFEIPIPAVMAAAEYCVTNDVPLVLNPSPVSALPAGLLESCSAVVVNDSEYAALGFDVPLPRAWTLVRTRGADGCEASDGTSMHYVPAEPADVVDTVGAGDAFTAGFAVGLAQGGGLTEALQLASAIAHQAVEQRGARVQLSRAELRESLQRYTGSGAHSEA
jgi:ribokinase